MRSFINTLLIAILSSLASAQYSINPDAIPIATRNTWCSSQINECPLICLQYPNAQGVPESNTCNATLLAYSCVCSNGLQPNASQYSQTLPYFVCTEWGNQCVAACGTDNTCASACRDNHPCGAQNPVRANTSTITSTMSSTSTGVPVGATTSGGVTLYTGFGGSAPTSTASSGSATSGASAAAMALDIGQSYGIVVVAASFFGGFALLL